MQLIKYLYKMKMRILIPVLVTGLFVFASCSKEESQKEENKKEKSAVVNASGTDWKYFSFAKGKEVTVEDPKTSLDWDIAFNRYYVKLNGGDSGKGQAEVIKTDKTVLSEVKEVPASGYSKDKQGVMSLGMPPKPTKGSFSATISGGIKGENTTGYVTIDMANMMTGKGDIYGITKYVYVVKTAEGKPLKLQFTDYTSSEGKGGYPAFSYQFAEGGKF